ncbi:MAG TPA: hypothetical protein VNN12_04495, partial [Dehalococcoidia bacterium]|nr:hypothetical protein [Dehalococcoidia bacterium]
MAAGGLDPVGRRDGGRAGRRADALLEHEQGIPAERDHRTAVLRAPERGVDTRLPEVGREDGDEPVGYDEALHGDVQVHGGEQPGAGALERAQGGDHGADLSVRQRPREAAQDVVWHAAPADRRELGRVAHRALRVRDEQRGLTGEAYDEPAGDARDDGVRVRVGEQVGRTVFGRDRPQVVNRVVGHVPAGEARAARAVGPADPDRVAVHLHGEREPLVAHRAEVRPGPTVEDRDPAERPVRDRE